MALIRVKDAEVMKHKSSIIEQIDTYARSVGLLKKNGAYFDRNGRYAGSMYDVGRDGKIDMGDK